MAHIRVTDSTTEIEAPCGTNLLQLLQSAEHPISTSCGGRATCGLCRVTIQKGAELLNKVNPSEIGHLGNVAKVVAIRLACQTVVVADGDIEVTVPPVLDVSLRKRNQHRKAPPSRNSAPGSGLSRPSSPERIEWRPRLLETKPEEPKG